MEAHPEPRTADPQIGQLSSTQHSVPRPKYFVSRPDGTKSPLIAADELPCSISIVGLPTTISIEQTFGMVHVAIQEREPYPATAYTLEIAGSSLHSSKHQPLRANAIETKSEEFKSKHGSLQRQEHNPNHAKAVNDSVKLTIEEGDKNRVIRRAPNYKNPCKYWSANGSCPFGKKCFWKHGKPAGKIWRTSETSTAHDVFFQPEQILAAVEASSVETSLSISVVPLSKNVGYVNAASATSATVPMAIEEAATVNKPEAVTPSLSIPKRRVNRSVMAVNNMPSFTISANSPVAPTKPERTAPVSELGKATLSSRRYYWPDAEPQSLLDQYDNDDFISICPIPTLIPTASRPLQSAISSNVQAQAMPLEIEAQSISPYSGDDEPEDFYPEEDDEEEEEPENFAGAEEAMS